jgi:CRISPR-associated endonuclease/helicase Cas3
LILTAHDFTEFYRQVHQQIPFPWQRDLVGRVLGERRWPNLVDVPTGLGKTSVIDIAVFVAAATASRPGPDRIGRRRCLFVVDRRIVVDEATDHARALAGALSRAEGTDGVLGAVATGLRSYAPDAGGELLPVTRMRGGATWAAAWLDRPDRPGIVLGTVDQVGSRLLFRGYGVSDRRRPIDAALVGADALLLLDEAHLATALAMTIEAAGERDRLGLPLPGLDVVRLTATSEPTDASFQLDVAAHRDDEEAWRRLTAAKELVLVETTARGCPRMMADAALRLTAGHGTGAWASTALVVCNTVDRARAVHALITQDVARRGGPAAVDCDLLIGRSRPADRSRLQDRLLARFGTDRPLAARPTVLVATQTVEVGINLDVDALVTESASWDALVQRLGRLNRLGHYTRRFPDRVAAPAVVVHDGQADGPVYGTVRDETWQALASLAPAAALPDAAGFGEANGIPASPLQCRELSLSAMRALAAARPGTPVLQVPTLDAWASTAPIPMADPPVDVFLHGFDTGRAGVLVAWRDGLVVDDGIADPFEDDEDDAEQAAAAAHALLTAMPVRTGEQVEVPFIAVRQWMAGQPAPSVSDVEFAPEQATRPRQEREPFRALAWRADRAGASSTWQWIDAADLRPGDQLVVPSERGGLDAYGWAPASVEPVADVSEAVTFAPAGNGRARPMLRLDARLADRLALAGEGRDMLVNAVHQLWQPEDPETPLAEHARRIVGALVEALRASPHEQRVDGATEVSGGSAAQPPSRVDPDRVLEWLGTGPRIVEVVGRAGAVIADQQGPPVLAHLLVGGRLRGDGPETSRGADAERDDEDPAASSVGIGQVTLARHLTAVRARAGRIAAALGLPPSLVDVVEDAAGWHDLGKIEERFQVMLHGGNPHEVALAVEPLAKSGIDPADRLAWQRSRRDSGLPSGARHEAWSAALVEAYLAERDDPYPGDVDLLVHLVASHHGHARPLLPLVTDPQPRPIDAVVDGHKVTVSSADTVCLQHPARFARLNARYGRWGLALLEAIVRCADMTVSAEGS